MSSETDASPDLEQAVRALGDRLGPLLLAVVDAAGGVGLGPQRLGDALGLDKVLASRLLKALRCDDPVTRLHYLPGPDPLRRFLRAAKRKMGVDPALIEPAAVAVEDFDHFLTKDLGDRSALTSLLAAWSIEVRTEFELRRKQTAWRAMSELRGASVDLDVSAVLLRPSAEEGRLDITWVMGLVGLRRLRPGVPIKVTTHKVVAEDAQRHPRDLDGKPLGGVDSGRLDEFCVSPPGRFDIRRTGDLLQYTLDGNAYGPNLAVDLLLAEVNVAEMAATVERGSGRRGWVYSDTPIPARRMVLDVFVHEDVYPGAAPELLLYDTAGQGVADVNDRGRDLDRLDLVETVETIGRGLRGAGIKSFAPYRDLMKHVFSKLAWDAEEFVLHRVEVDYPLHGMQVAVAFEAPEDRPEE